MKKKKKNQELNKSYSPIKINGAISNSASEIASHFNSYFTGIAPCLDRKLPRPTRDPLSYLSGNFEDSMVALPASNPCFYGPSGPPHGYIPTSACGSLFGEDCNNENEPNNRETCLSIYLVKINMILAIQIT